MEFYSQQPLHFYTQSEEPTGNGQAHGQVHCNKNPSLSVYKVIDNDSQSRLFCQMAGADRHGERDGLHLEKYRGNYEYEQIDYYKDPSEHFLVVTKCRDNKAICEFFEHAE